MRSPINCLTCSAAALDLHGAAIWLSSCLLWEIAGAITGSQQQTALLSPSEPLSKKNKIANCTGTIIERVEVQAQGPRHGKNGGKAKARVNMMSTNYCTAWLGHKISCPVQHFGITTDCLNPLMKNHFNIGM